MTPFGEDLRRQREARGVAVHEICAMTKVSAQHVYALEAGELALLPGGVFRKGIVRSYLQALGLDEVLYLERFEQSCREAGLAGGGEQDWVQFAENVRMTRPQVRSGMDLRWVGVLLLMVGLWAIAWIAWHAVRRHRQDAGYTAWAGENAGGGGAGAGTDPAWRGRGAVSWRGIDPGGKIGGLSLSRDDVVGGSSVGEARPFSVYE